MTDERSEIEESNPACYTDSNKKKAVAVIDNGLMLPKEDIIFKLLFGDQRNIESLTNLLQSILTLPAEEYEEVTIVDPHLLREYKGDKLGILDVKVKTKTQKVIDVEIQVKLRDALRERVIFNLSKLITGQISSGNSYTAIKRSICIFITDFPFIPENNKYHNSYTLCDPRTQSQFTDLLQVDILELPKLSQDDGTELWNWLKFLSARRKEDLDMVAQKSPQVKKAVARYMELSSDEETRLLYESRRMYEMDMEVRENQARNEGIEQGIKQGIEHNKREMARSLKKDKVLSLEQIALYSELSVDEVEKL